MTLVLYENELTTNREIDGARLDLTNEREGQRYYIDEANVAASTSSDGAAANKGRGRQEAAQSWSYAYPLCD